MNTKTDTQEQRVELLPCPFCGSEGEAVCLRAGEDSVYSWTRCLSCDARIGDIEDAYGDLPAARAAWNTRHRARASGEVEAAAREVLKHRVGEQPTRGWLKDNDASRSALTALAAALGESTSHG